jgi:hypothetical protein
MIQISSSYISIVDSLKLALRTNNNRYRAACPSYVNKERVVIVLEWDTKAGHYSKT